MITLADNTNMSLFSLTVIGPNVEQQLQPFHEYECTGVLDQYVLDVDQTTKMREEYAADTIRRLKGPDGKLHSPSEPQFYREFTPEEIERHGHKGELRMMGTGWGNGISWDSREWGDGKGYRAKVSTIPEGFEEVTVPASEIYDFRAWLSNWHGYSEWPIKGTEPERDNEDFAGSFFTLDNEGHVAKVIRRTNPNKKWDWFEIGGRYKDRLILKDGSKTNSAVKSQLDLEAMLEASYADYPLTSFALLKDGQWVERGTMGWWAQVSNEMPEEEWHKAFWEQIQALPDDTLLTVVDCHI